MTPDEADELLADVLITPGEVWADLGAGTGVFTRAIARRLGPTGVVYAVDRDADVLRHVGAETDEGAARIIPVVADFQLQFESPGANARRLDGMMFANSLHYLDNARDVLGRLATWLSPNGQVVVIEYDRRRANPWVPFPIPIASLGELTRATGLTTPTVVAKRPSAYEGELYVAVSRRES